MEVKDLELLEKRVFELEKYLGVDHLDMEIFQSEEMESMDKKTQKLDDFIKVIEDKHFFLMELFEKCKIFFDFVIVDKINFMGFRWVNGEFFEERLAL